MSHLEFSEIQRRLEQQSGRDYWKTLQEMAKEPAFQNFLKSEFPSRYQAFAGELPQDGEDWSVERRGFLHLMGASMALAGLGSCTRQPKEVIKAWASSPESTTPGEAQFFATAMPGTGDGLGLLVESNMGRPTKIEGNPDHPMSRGATDTWAQASVYELYDPDRSHVVLRNGRIDSWGSFTEGLTEATSAGSRVRILSGAITSPTLQAAKKELLEQRPTWQWHTWEALHRDAEREGAELAFGQDVEVRPDFSGADVVWTLDCELFGGGGTHVRMARDFMDARRARKESQSINRLYVLESRVSLAGGMADHRLAVDAQDLEGIARWVAKRLGVDVPAPEIAEGHVEFARGLVDELGAAKGRSLVLCGGAARAELYALVHALNQALGNVGKTVSYGPRVDATPEPCSASIQRLAKDIQNGEVESLIMLGGNPVYDAPAELGFRDLLLSVPYRAHLSLYEDETSQLCHWHVAAAHFLESWGDVRGWHGQASLIQPLIAPLYGGKTELEVVAALAGKAGVGPYAMVREHWAQAWGFPKEAAETDALGKGTNPAFEEAWSRALHDGLLPNSEWPALEVSLGAIDFGAAPEVAGGLQLIFESDASVYDGRYANNGWLQELPRPLTRMVWDNAALIAPATAEALDVESGDVVQLDVDGRSIEIAAWVNPGQPAGVIGLALGYGREKAGRIGTGVGVDAYPLRTAQSAYATRVAVTKTGARNPLVTVQDHGSMEGRDIVRRLPFEHLKGQDEVFHKHHHGDREDLSMYPAWPREGNQWGMVIDQSACVGCNACMVACQSENNVPIVGREEVANGRELHWLRIDRYYEGDLDRPLIVHQPVNCMHCEQAPCEVVCPVAATVHGPEGLNEMVYNRCVGTRYCSNNCPYKVRRFNFYHYADIDEEVEKFRQNPDVTVRTRGVMEKCTYCVQRINQARQGAKVEGRERLDDGEVVTACQAVCPTQAITFGDVDDPKSKVAELREEPHHYALLEELGTKPRTTYLARVMNPNPELTPLDPAGNSHDGHAQADHAPSSHDDDGHGSSDSPHAPAESQSSH